jgi:hypothetical protein
MALFDQTIIIQAPPYIVWQQASSSIKERQVIRIKYEQGVILTQNNLGYIFWAESDDGVSTRLRLVLDVASRVESAVAERTDIPAAIDALLLQPEDPAGVFSNNNLSADSIGKQVLYDLQTQAEQWALSIPKAPESTQLKPLENNDTISHPEADLEIEPSKTAVVLNIAVIVSLILQGLFWLGIASLQLILYLSGSPGASLFWIIWNFTMPFFYIFIIRDAFLRYKRVVNNLLVFGIIGIIWGVVQLFSGVWVQACVILMLFVCVILPQINKPYYVRNPQKGIS